MKRIEIRVAMALVCLMLVMASGASAQNMVNPTKAQFTASTDHDAAVGGMAVVTSYQLDAMIGTATGALAFSANLGKPTPDASRVIVVPVPQFLTMPNGSYVATVSAVGPGGAGKSAPSNPFSRIGAPAAPTAVSAVP